VQLLPLLIVILAMPIAIPRGKARMEDPADDADRELVGARS
jgi:hypothetical protein